MSTHLVFPVKLRVGNVSGEADAAFMAELKRTDRPRYDRVVEAMQKQAYKDLKATQPTENESVTC
jgi:hypothetical protein